MTAARNSRAPGRAHRSLVATFLVAGIVAAACAPRRPGSSDSRPAPASQAGDAHPRSASAFTAPRAAGAIGGDPVEELLRLHHRQRIAHVLADARMLARSFEGELVELNRGSISVRSPEALLDRFSTYLGGVRFLEWEDVRPPRIGLSPDSQWAEVVVEKRVRTIPADTIEMKREDYAVFAWLERWVRTASGWRLATIASTHRPGEDAEAASLADRTRAYEILRRARAALGAGGEEAVARIATLRFTAECEGPRGPFRTTVASARDGRVRFVQGFPDRPRFAAGISLAGAWHLTGQDPRVNSFDPVLGTVITGHEMHLLAIAPEARFTAPAARPVETLDGDAVQVVRFRDALAAPADFLYDVATGRPLGFRMVNHTGRGPSAVLTRFSDWRRVGDILLPFAIVISHGDEVYRYRVTDATTDWLTDGEFRAPVD